MPPNLPYGRLPGTVCRKKGIAREDMLDVGKHQLLMLLFVIQAELDNGGERFFHSLGDPVEHLSIDDRTIVLHFRETRPR